MTLFAPYVCEFILKLPCTSVESSARLHVKTSISLFSYYTETTRTTYHVPVPGIYSHSQHRFAAGTPIVLLYEKGDAVRIEPRPPSPNTCRLCARSSRTLFEPKRAATAPACRACSASPEHRVRIKLRLTAAAVRGARRQLLTMAHTSTASCVPDAVPRVPG